MEFANRSSADLIIAAISSPSGKASEAKVMGIDH
jgi:hypothetical protein